MNQNQQKVVYLHPIRGAHQTTGTGKNIRTKINVLVRVIGVLAQIILIAVMALMQPFVGLLILISYLLAHPVQMQPFQLPSE
jgi:hypothetical protein